MNAKITAGTKVRHSITGTWEVTEVYLFDGLAGWQARVNLQNVETGATEDHLDAQKFAASISDGSLEIVA